MIRLHENGRLIELADMDAIIAHLELSQDRRHDETVAGLKAASDAGFPLHVVIDPYADDIHGRRVLMVSDSEASLRREYRQACQDI